MTGGGVRNLPPERRVAIGRNVILTMGALYALSRSIYYATVRPESLSGAQEMITGGGAALGLWSALWGLGVVFCVVDMVNRHTRHGLSIVAGIALGWGIGYLLIWAFTGFADPQLVNGAIGWFAPSLFIFGFLLKVNGLQDMLKAKVIP